MRGTGGNGSILEFDEFGSLIATNATGLSMPTALTIDQFGNIFVAEQGGAVQEFSGGSSNTIATITNAEVSLQGIALFNDGTIAVSDAGDDVIWTINPVNDAISLLSGAVGQPGSTLSKIASNARLNDPHQLVLAAGNQLLVADTGNNRIVVVESSGAITNVLQSTNSEVWFGRAADPALPSSSLFVPISAPVGVALASNGVVFDSEGTGENIRGNLGTGLTPPPPPQPAPGPIIGEVISVTNDVTTMIVSSNSSYILNNDLPIAIQGNGDSQVYYNVGATAAAANIPNPSATNGSSAVIYIQGQPNLPTSIVTAANGSDQTIKAVGVNPGSPASPVIVARVQYVVANPLISGNNAAQFTVSDLTVGAQMWYTLDGSNPTNTAPSLGPITNGATLSLNITTNTTFKIAAFLNNYQPSGVITTVFTTTNFNANALTFGFASGEASSQFIASPGQFFYAPVTMSVLPATRMDSLQFEMSVTNLINLPGTNSPAVGLGQIGFQSFLEKPDPSNATIYYVIPPAMSRHQCGVLAVSIPNRRPASPSTNDGVTYGVTFVSAIETNDTDNQIGVGWLERAGEAYLFDTGSQDLIQFSQPHDTLFLQSGGGCGGRIWFPGADQLRSRGTYVQIQLTRPSATSGRNWRSRFGRLYRHTQPTVLQRTAPLIPSSMSRSARLIISRVIPRTSGGSTRVILAIATSTPLTWPRCLKRRYMRSMPRRQAATSLTAWTPAAALHKHDDRRVFMRTTLRHLDQLPQRTPCIGERRPPSIPIAFGDGKLDVTDVYVTFRRSFDPGRSGSAVSGPTA